MLEQRIHNHRPNALQGVGIVLLIAAAALAGNAFFLWLGQRIGAVSSALFILYGCAVAWLMMDRFALGFVYTSNADCLRVCRVYGKRERFMTDVWLNKVQAYGTPEEMKRRFPGARVSRATRRQCPLAPLALAHNSGGRTAILVIQPDDALRAHLIGVLRRGR